MSSEHDDLFWAALPLPPECADDEPGFAEEFGVTPGEVRAWLAQDPERQRRAIELEAEFAADLETLVQLREDRELPPIMEGFTDRVMSEVQPVAPRGRLLVFRRYGLAAAAALLFALTVGAIWGSSGDSSRSLTAEEPSAPTLPRKSSADVLNALPEIASGVPTPELRPGVSPRNMRSLDPQVPVGRASGGAAPATAGDLLLRRFLEDLPNLRDNLEELRRASEPAEDETFRF